MTTPPGDGDVPALRAAVVPPWPEAQASRQCCFRATNDLDETAPPVIGIVPWEKEG